MNIPRDSFPKHTNPSASSTTILCWPVLLNAKIKISTIRKQNRDTDSLRSKPHLALSLLSHHHRTYRITHHTTCFSI